MFTRSFDRFANHDAAKPEAVAPPPGGRMPPARTAQEADQWFDGYKLIDPNNRKARFEYLEAALTLQLANMVNYLRSELRNCLAIALLADDGLWQEFLDDDDRRRYRTANHFLQVYLQMWGLGSSATRVSRLRSSADFWIDLKSRGLPVPDSLSRLECLSTREDRVEVYEELVIEACHEAPSDWAIKSKVAKLRGRPAPVRRAKPNEQSPVEMRRELVNALAQLVASDKQDEGAIGAKARELAASCKPTKPREAPPRLPPYDQTWGCPIQLVENEEEFRIEVISLPEKLSEFVQKEGRIQGWPRQKNNDGSFACVIERFPEEIAENHARRNWLNRWAELTCTKLGAPLPRPLVAVLPGETGKSGA